MRRTHLLLPAVLLSVAGAAAAQPDPLASRSKGSATAPVTVYEMSDFQCPYCKRFTEQFFPTIEKEYVATGKVRWIFINLPLVSIHANAVPAAEFAMCAAREGKFWPAHDLLYRRQEVWAPLKNPAAFLLSLADSLKIPRSRITPCLEKGETRELVRSDSEGSVKAGAGSTPTFYIEGGLLAGAHPPELWRPILDSVIRVKTRKP
jgi:protein-disulfide isomerase